MTLLNPAFLWALAALVPLAALYLLKVRPRRKPATAIFLWQQVFNEKKATSLFQRLRDAVSLLLMLLAVIAVVLAMTKPQLAGDERRDLVILLDRSASMAAAEGGGTRLNEARAEAHAIIRALGTGQQAAVASVTDRITYHTHFTRDPRRLADAVDAVTQTDVPLRSGALGELSDREDWAADYRVILISDGLLGGGEPTEDVELLRVGAPRDNAGIVGADLKRLPGGSDRLGLYVQVASSYEQPFETDLLVEHEGTLQRVLPLTVEPGVNEPAIFELEGGSGAWQLTLETADDALAVDNHAYLALPPRQPVRVAVDADDPYFFQHSVRAFAEAEGSLALVEPEQQPDILLVQGDPTTPSAGEDVGPADAAEVASPALRVVFQPEGQSPLWSNPGDRLERVVPRPRQRDHPALRFVDIEAMAFAGARQLSAPEHAVVLAETAEGVPLIWQVRTADRADLVVNLDPRESELFFSTSFPVLVHGAVTHLARRTESLAATYQPGRTAPIPGGAEDVETRVQSPVQRAAQETDADAADQARIVRADRLGPMDRAGFYRMENAAGQYIAAATLASRSETLLRTDAVASTVKPLARGWPPSALLLLLAIVVLVVESLLYQRRKVG